jgi:superfamily I DNA/RNA helicase
MAAIDLIVGCFSGITELKNDRKLYAKGDVPTVRKGKLADVRHSLVALAIGGSMDELAQALDAVTTTKTRHQGRLFRPELWADAVRSTKGLAADKVGTLRESAWKRRDYVRNNGKKTTRFSVGRPLLIKGLEFDHAVVLGGDTASFNREELYVALTRASSSLTIATASATLVAKASGGKADSGVESSTV